MLTYTIKKPSFSDTLIDRIRGRAKQPISNIPVVIALPPPENRVLDQVPWAKYQYGIWIERVKEKFKVGDLVTYEAARECRPTSVLVKPIYFEVTYIEEMHRECKFDVNAQEPLALTLKTVSGRLINKCPKYFRHLTDGEKALVDLQNKV